MQTGNLEEGHCFSFPFSLLFSVPFVCVLLILFLTLVLTPQFPWELPGLLKRPEDWERRNLILERGLWQMEWGGNQWFILGIPAQKKSKSHRPFQKVPKAAASSQGRVNHHSRKPPGTIIVWPSPPSPSPPQHLSPRLRRLRRGLPCRGLGMNECVPTLLTWVFRTPDVGVCVCKCACVHVCVHGRCKPGSEGSPAPGSSARGGVKGRVWA